MFTSCLDKQQRLTILFTSFEDNEEAKYKKIIDFGKNLPPLPLELRTHDSIVKGCQSIMYLHAYMEDNYVYFKVYSEALISAGLASILISVYSGEKPETILKCKPDFLETLGIGASLTPSRANGLYSIHLKMKQEALRLLLQQNK